MSLLMSPWYLYRLDHVARCRRIGILCRYTLFTLQACAVFWERYIRRLVRAMKSSNSSLICLHMYQYTRDHRLHLHFEVEVEIGAQGESAWWQVPLTAVRGVKRVVGQLLLPDQPFGQGRPEAATCLPPGEMGCIYSSGRYNTIIQSTISATFATMGACLLLVPLGSQGPKQLAGHSCRWADNQFQRLPVDLNHWSFRVPRLNVTGNSKCTHLHTFATDFNGVFLF